MIGAIIGDIVGSPYEFNANNIKTTDFPLFSEKSAITDDSVMTCAVAEALFYAGNSELYFKETLIETMIFVLLGNGLPIELKQFLPIITQ